MVTTLGVIFSKIVVGFQSKAAPKIWLLLFGITEMDFFRLSMFSNFQILNAWLWVSCGWQWMPGWRGDNIQRLDCPLPATGTTHYQLTVKGDNPPTSQKGSVPSACFSTLEHENTLFNTRLAILNVMLLSNISSNQGQRSPRKSHKAANLHEACLLCE